MYLIALWDLLVLALVAFPLLTGGVWLEHHGSITAELSDIGIPVLLLTVLGAGLALGLRKPLSQSASLRAGARLWKAWQEAVERRPARALWGAAAFTAALWTWASLRKHWAFASNEFDLGIFTNAIWNLTHGFGYVSAPKDGINLFADHQSPIFWALAPLFWLIPRPETLLVAQAAALAAGGVAAYRLAAQYLPERHWARAAIPLLYWGYLPLRNANAFDFHPEVLMLPLFLAGIAGMQSERGRSRALGALALAAALGGKESAGPVAAGVGLAWLLGAGPAATRRFTRWAGVILAAAGAAVFVFDLKLVPKLAGAGQYAYYQGFYSQFGGGLFDIILAPVLKPGLFWPLMIEKARRQFLFWTLAPLGFLPLLGWRAFLAALPGYLMLFLSSGDHRVNVGYHYAIEPAVGLLWALPLGILALEKRRRHAVVWLLFWALAAHGRSELFRVRFYHPTEHTRWAASQVLPCLSPDAPFAATNAWAPHLAARHWEHNITSVEGADCVLEDRALSIWPLESAQIDLEERKWKEQGFREIFRCGEDFRIYESPRARGHCLVCQPECAR